MHSQHTHFKITVRQDLCFTFRNQEAEFSCFLEIYSMCLITVYFLQIAVYVYKGAAETFSVEKKNQLGICPHLVGKLDNPQEVQ